MIPKRNWRKWWYAYGAHMLTGAISGGFTAFAVSVNEWTYAFAIALSVLCFWRQTVEYLRRNDTPGRDMGDHITGWAIAFILVYLIIKSQILENIKFSVF